MVSKVVVVRTVSPLRVPWRCSLNVTEHVGSKSTCPVQVMSKSVSLNVPEHWNCVVSGPNAMPVHNVSSMVPATETDGPTQSRAVSVADQIPAHAAGIVGKLTARNARDSGSGDNAADRAETGDNESARTSTAVKGDARMGHLQGEAR